MMKMKGKIKRKEIDEEIEEVGIENIEKEEKENI